MEPAPFHAEHRPQAAAPTLMDLQRWLANGWDIRQIATDARRAIAELRADAYFYFYLFWCPLGLVEWLAEYCLYRDRHLIEAQAQEEQLRQQVEARVQAAMDQQGAQL